MRPYVLRDDEQTRRERAAEIRAFRVRFGLTQKKLAELIEVNRKTIMNAEKGKHCVQLNILGKFQRFKLKYEYERQRAELQILQEQRFIVDTREAVRQGQKPPSRWD